MMSGYTNTTTWSHRAMLKKYPSGLPAAQKRDRAFQMVDPLVSTQSSNGQTRWYRRFTDVPTATPVSWIFSDLQCQVFQGWFKDTLRDGAEWFDMPLTTDVGRHVEQCHFVQAYSGPKRLGFNRWQIGADIVLRRRPLGAPNDGLFPDEILRSDILDRTINLEWPKA